VAVSAHEKRSTLRPQALALPAARSTLDLARTRSLIGAWAKISILQFFAVEAAAIAAWTGPQPYSRRVNVISDLGAAHCGVYDGRNVCSPLNWLMNISFVVQGLALVLGAILLSTAVFRFGAVPGAGPSERPSAWATTTRVLVGLSGFGVMLVGIAPEDVNFILHYGGAASYFVGGALALVMLSWSWRGRQRISWFLLLCGALSLIATVIFVLVPDLEKGTVERLMAYPVTVGWSSVGLVVAQGVQRARSEMRQRATLGRAASA
jgi:hypothetical membrane protein